MKNQNLFLCFPCASSRQKIMPVLLLAGLCGILSSAQAETPYYHLHRKLVPIDCYIYGAPTISNLYAESEELTDTIVGTIELKSNQTYAIERQAAIPICYGSAEAAWNAATNYSGTTTSNYPGKIFDNVGWLRGTRFVNGGWGAYLLVIQNRIAFLSSPSKWWTTTNGLQIEITNVMVGTLGDYQAASNVVDIGPKIPTNFFGASSNEVKQFQVDITNVGYQLFIPRMWVEPRYAYRCVGGSNVQYSLISTNITNGVTWSLIPDLSGSGGATSQPNADWHYREITPGNIATNYKVRATSVDNTNFFDQVELTVVKVAAIELVSGATASNVIPANTWVTVKNTNPTPEYVVFQAVIDPDVAETNLPGDFITWTGGVSVAGQPLQRKVDKQSAIHTQVVASCGISSATGNVWIVWADLEIRMTGTTYQTPNSARFGVEYYDRTENLGTRLYDYRDSASNFISRAAAGKVAPIGKLEPAGLNTIATNGWVINREMIRHSYKDGAVWPQEWHETWTDDTTSYEPFVRLEPDDLNQIYDLDAPNIAKFQGLSGYVTNSCERYDHYRQWVTWNGARCSADALWHWFARWQCNTNYDLQITYTNLGVGNPDFPTNAPVYAVKVDLILKNMSATVADGGSIADLDETQEEAAGAEIRINADFDETPTVKQIEDFRHSGIEPTDPDLLDGTLKIEGGSAQGKWKLIFPDKVKVWTQDGSNWVEVTSGTESSIVTVPTNLQLKVEGIDGSTNTTDIEVKAEFTPACATVAYSDKALVISVKTEFMLTFDDGPFSDNSKTMQVVDNLTNAYVNGEKVRVAFFMVGHDGSGDMLGDLGGKEGVDGPNNDNGNFGIVQSVSQAGHAVGNHTDTHKHAWYLMLGVWEKVNVTDYTNEIQACKTRLDDALDPDHPRIFRPPYWGLRQAYGDYNDNIDTAAANKGYQIIWGTSRFGEIYVLTPTAWEVIADNTIKYLKDKWNSKAQPALKDKPAIICYHEYWNPIPGNIWDIVKRIQNKGFLLQRFDNNRCSGDRLYYPQPD